jgi:hypothetical protein
MDAFSILAGRRAKCIPHQSTFTLAAGANQSRAISWRIFLTVVVVGLAVQLFYNPNKSYLLVKD